MSDHRDHATPRPRQDAEERGLRRVLGPVDATCVVVGAIVGVGIFFTPARVADLAGSGGLALLAWTIGGAIALLGALTFAELGGLYPRTGGQYDILRDACGPLPAFLFVFCNATAIQGGAAAIIAIVCTNHLAIALGTSLSSVATVIVAAALIIALGLANARGVRWGSGIQNLTVFAKVATLLCVSALAVVLGEGGAAGSGAAGVEEGGAASAARAGLGGAAAVFAGLVPALFSYGGWQQALWVAGEVRRPRRDVPLSIIGGVVLVVALYLLVNWAYLRLLGFERVAASAAPAADAVAAVWPGMGERAVAAAVAISAFGVLNAQLLTGPRLVYGMARDGRFLAIFGQASRRHGTPVAAIALIAGMALLLLLIAGEQGIPRLLTGVVFIDSIFFALTAVALIILRRRRPDADRPVRVPLYPLVPLLFVAGEIAVMVGAALDADGRKAALGGAAWIAAAFVCYLAIGAPHSGQTPDTLRSSR